MAAATASAEQASSPTVEVHREDDPEDLDGGEFARSIALGAGFGIPIMAVATFFVTRAVTPETHAGAAVGLAIWVGLWAGLFIGGVVAVGGHLIRGSHH